MSNIYETQCDIKIEVKDFNDGRGVFVINDNTEVSIEVPVLKKLANIMNINQTLKIIHFNSQIIKRIDDLVFKADVPCIINYTGVSFDLGIERNNERAKFEPLTANLEDSIALSKFMKKNLYGYMEYNVFNEKTSGYKNINKLSDNQIKEFAECTKYGQITYSFNKGLWIITFDSEDSKVNFLELKVIPNTDNNLICSDSLHDIYEGETFIYEIIHSSNECIIYPIIKNNRGC